MGAPSPRRGKRRPRRSALARAALILLLLPQLAALWVLSRPAPTRLPAALVAAVTDGLLGEATAEVGAATIDGRGAIRIKGLRIGHAPSGLGFEGDARVTPPWSSWLALRPDLPAIEVRGRLGELGGATLAEDVVLRASDPRGARLDLAARLGGVRLRVESRAPLPIPEEASADTPPAAAPDWVALIREASRLQGGAEVRLSEGGWVAETSLRGDPDRAGAAGWRLGSVEARLRNDKGGLAGWARITEAGRGDLGAGLLRAHILGDAVHATLEKGRWGALAEVSGALDLDWDNRRVRAEGHLASGESRLLARVSREHGGEWSVDRLAGRLRSAEVLRAPGVAAALRAAEVDLSGTVELGAGEVRFLSGAPCELEGWFALDDAGWKDLRPAVIRPERRANLTGRARVDLRAKRFEATDLDLAGIVGSIEGGIAAGDRYVVRLATSPDNPFRQACLASLLGGWWVDLWNLFDLSTGRSAPHAEVRVEGRWGASTTERLEVSATLDRFGFMGARFAETAVRVEATPATTRVRIDRLVGELDGKPAGSARGTATWDWSSGSSLPDIVAEGDLEPLVALRMLERGRVAAERLRGASFGQPWLKVAIPRQGGAEVRLSTKGPSQILGAQLGPLSLDLSLRPPGQSPMPLRAKGEVVLAGGKLALELEGDLAERNVLHGLRIEGIRWAQLPKALPFLFSAQANGETSAATLDGNLRGDLVLGDTPDFQGSGDFILRDPNLRRVQLFGTLSKGLDALGLGFSGYDLTEARGRFTLKDQKAQLPELVIGGEDAEINLKGQLDLRTGGIDFEGDFRLKDSDWGPLGYLNPNRLITKAIKLRIGGTMAKPETKVRAGL